MALGAHRALGPAARRSGDSCRAGWAWTSDRRSSPWSARPATTAWARSVRTTSRLLRRQGAARGDGGRHRRRQPPSVLRRPDALRESGVAELLALASSWRCSTKPTNWPRWVCSSSARCWARLAIDRLCPRSCWARAWPRRAACRTGRALQARLELAARELRLVCAGALATADARSARPAQAWPGKSAPNGQALPRPWARWPMPRSLSSAIECLATVTASFRRTSSAPARAGRNSCETLAQDLCRQGRPSPARCAGSTSARSRRAWSQSPLDIRQAMQEQLARGPPKAWVFTSATLGDDEQLDLVHRACGPGCTPRCCASAVPFDYAGHARLYHPTAAFPSPTSPIIAAEVAALAARCARVSSVRTQLSC